MIRTLLAAALMLTATGLASAASAPDWVVDSEESSVSFRYVEDGTEKTGSFAKFSANVTFDPARPEDTQAAFDVETASIDLDDSLREGVLVTTPWFDSEKHPLARFSLTELTPAEGRGIYWANGTLTVKGKQRPVRFKTTVTINDRAARAQGTLLIDRTEFLLRDAVVEAIVTVGSSVSIAFDLVAHRTD